MVTRLADYNEFDESLIARMIEYGCLKYLEKPVVLHSGALTNFYISTRDEVTTHLDLLRMLGWKIVLELDKLDHRFERVCLIGVPTAGQPLVQSACQISYNKPSRDNCEGTYVFELMNQSKKSYGTHVGWVYGKPDHSTHYYLIDNALSSGAAFYEAIQKLIADAYPIENVGALILVNRHTRAEHKFKQYALTCIEFVYELEDMVEFGVREKKMPKSALEVLHKEIAAGLRK